MYKITKLLGGGESWYYLLNTDNKIVIGIKQDHEKEYNYTIAVMDMLNCTNQNYE